ncbi:SGNH/GDSL hydrolase family protein [Singulisphaera acidiphila]|uniref:Lysophospholipase L1-like esterase n=1 Tax=Singulisphaera acidiphila (strain ATCC BAA-1392 / DSM 18658 / VKM B-2454 / MOB10) TaxID=886293 RepID=L0DCW1_SINAD|nr:GDSL-type esterase/lipase family protein [Singulisphaera acidiphila]AGA27082.1 lysophospholipase L1-like esterase [Singulisphaera acidiphila DSM 18658]
MNRPILHPRGYLPLVAVAILSAMIGAPERAPRVLLLGDSITLGVRPGVAANQTFGGQLETMIKARGLDASIINVGIGGERTDQALARLSEVLKANRPDIVLLMYGTNDSYVDFGRKTSRLAIDQYRKNYGELIERIEQTGAKTVLMTPPRWADDAPPNGLGENPNLRLEPFVELVRAIARERKRPLVDHYAVWSTARQNGVELMKWTTDGCHPNPDGHRAIAEEILPNLQPLLTATIPGKG